MNRTTSTQTRSLKLKSNDFLKSPQKKKKQLEEEKDADNTKKVLGKSIIQWRGFKN